MELHQLRYFVATAEAGSVSRAAHRCHVAQPSLSQQIRKLEDSLGVSLFDRIGRGVALTEAGRAFLPRARRILAEVRDAEAQLQTDLHEGRGTIAVGAIPTMAPYLLPGAIRALRTALPACQVSIREDLTEALVEALVDNLLDCAVVSTPIEHDLVDVEVVGHEELVVMMKRGNPLDAEGGVSLGALREQPAILLEDMHCLARQTRAFCTNARVSPKVVCRTTQLSTIGELVSLGLGVSIVPEMAANADREAALSYHRLKQNRPIRQIAVAWRRDRTRSRAAELFRDTLAEQIRGGAFRLDA